MKCPRCASDYAYVGVIDVKCVNQHCIHYDLDYAMKEGPLSKPAKEPDPAEYNLDDEDDCFWIS